VNHVSQPANGTVEKYLPFTMCLRATSSGSSMAMNKLTCASVRAAILTIKLE
jgi:hypothetical protein